METVVSGIRSTGNLHLGNYYGAIQNFVKMQHEYNCYFFIADLHSLTTHPTPGDLHGNIKQVLVEYLAAGIDPETACVTLADAPTSGATSCRFRAVIRGASMAAPGRLPPDCPRDCRESPRVHR